MKFLNPILLVIAALCVTCIEALPGWQTAGTSREVVHARLAFQLLDSIRWRKSAGIDHEMVNDNIRSLHDMIDEGKLDRDLENAYGQILAAVRPTKQLAEIRQIYPTLRDIVQSYRPRAH